MKQVWYFLFSFVLCLKITQSSTVQTPVGIKLCEDKCSSIEGCNKFDFNRAHLQCDLEGNSKDRKTHWSTHLPADHNQKEAKMCGRRTCLVGERCIMTKRGGGACVNTQVLKSKEYSLRRHLLIVPKHSRRRTWFYKLNLDTLVIERARFFSVKRVHAVIYVHKTGQLLISTSHPCIIQFYSLGGKKADILHKGVDGYDMAYDEERQILFYVEFSGDRIMKTSVITKDRQSLNSTRVKGMPYYRCLITDPSTETLYASSDGKSVISVAYDGNNFKILCMRTGVQNMLLDNVRNILYFTDKFSIYKIAVSDHENKQSLVTKLKVSLIGLEFYQQKIFIGTRDDRKLRILNVVNNNVSYIQLPSLYSKGLILRAIY